MAYSGHGEPSNNNLLKQTYGKLMGVPPSVRALIATISIGMVNNEPLARSKDKNSTKAIKLTRSSLTSIEAPDSLQRLSKKDSMFVRVRNLNGKRLAASCCTGAALCCTGAALCCAGAAFCCAGATFCCTGAALCYTLCSQGCIMLHNGCIISHRGDILLHKGCNMLHRGCVKVMLRKACNTITFHNVQYAQYTIMYYSIL